MKKSWFDQIGSFEMHHKIIAFALILTGTIAVTRLLAGQYDPDPILANVEIHHFDYGILLLIFTTLLLLFRGKDKGLYLVLSAIATGLIVDEYWFIRRNAVSDPALQIASYSTTFFTVVVQAVIIVLLMLFVSSASRRRK